MRRLVAAALMAGIAVLSASGIATADPEDHVPICSGDQTPMDSNCRVTPSQVVTHDGSGLSPNLPYGLDPAHEPAV
jgi:hypothetical protein